MLVALRVPAKSDRGPLYMDQALAAIHAGNPKRLPLTLSFTRRGKEVTLCCRFPEELAPVVLGQLYAHYPDARIEPWPEAVLDPPAGTRTWTQELRLTPDLFPLRRYGQFEDSLNRLTADPLTAILTTLAAEGDPPLAARIELTFRPARARLHARAERCLHRLSSDFFRSHRRLARLYRALALSHRLPFRCLGWLLGRLARAVRSAAPILSTSASRLHEREEDLQAAADKLGRLLFEAHLRLSVSGPSNRETQARAKLREMQSAFGPFHSPRLASFRAGRIRRGTTLRRRPLSPPFLLSTEEAATLWHPATLTVQAPTIATVASRELPPPVLFPTPKDHPGITILGTATFRSTEEPVGILPEDRLRHLAVHGKTGMGKSTLLLRLLASDIAAGRGVGLLDPHGDLCEAVLAGIPKQRTNNVILFDAGDVSHPLAFNVLACPAPAHRPLVVSGIVSSFKKVYGEFWGPRLEHILRNALLALLEVPGTTLLSLLRLLSDARYRAAIVGRVQDPVVRTFWEREFGGMPGKLQAEAIAPIQNKVGAFVSSPVLRHVIGQSRRGLDLRAAMDEGKVLLVNLSKGRLGDDASSLLGSFLVTALQLAAMSRADQPEAERRDFYLYVDEFQNYATSSFATILSEARKYRLALTIANQFLAQVEEQTLAAVFGNCGSLVCFQVGAQDAEVLAQQLGPDVLPGDLLQLPRYQAYVRLLIDGQPSRPFSLRTLPPPATSSDPLRPAMIRRYSRQRYARPLAQVEQDIRRALTAV